MLGTSRGPQDVGMMVDFLRGQSIDVLFCIGGDGTHRGAHAISGEIGRRGLPIGVVGIPKTIDNDIDYCDWTFGYLTAVDAARDVIHLAHTEARGTSRGVGLVKLMGRNSGFIACMATRASQEANFVLIPESPFAGFTARPASWPRWNDGSMPATTRWWSSPRGPARICSSPTSPACVDRVGQRAAPRHRPAAPPGDSRLLQGPRDARSISSTSTPATSSAASRRRPRTSSCAMTWPAAPSTPRCRGEPI